MNEYQQRQEAVAMYLRGIKATHVAVHFKKSRKWVHHWIKRYKHLNGEVDWFADESKAPKKVSRALSADTEQIILLIRKELMSEKMSQIGAISIQYECLRRGIQPIPPVWIINRVIAKHGLNKEKSVHKTPKDYPELFVHVHQMDLVGPRYIKGDGRFYSVNLIDTVTHSCYVKAVRTKSSDEVVNAIASFWKIHGMPDALQMDNELSFRGSNKYPHSFGKVIRFALSQGVAVIFIPVSEPWRNGMMEKFNDTYQKHFLKAFTFESFEALSSQEQSFIDHHNKEHRYSSQGHKTPNEACALELPPLYYHGTIHLPALKPTMKIPLTTGSVYFIRFIRSDLKLFMPGEVFMMLPALKYSYVVAEVNIDNHSLVIRQNDEIKQVFPYTIEAIDW
jgi:putative transposase